MSVKIRLKRFGKRSKPTYRVIAIEEGKKRQGREVELLGFYDPNFDPPKIKLDQKRIAYWLGVGARSSQTVNDLIRKSQKSPK